METDSLSECFDASLVELWEGDPVGWSAAELRQLFSTFDRDDNGPCGFIATEDFRKACASIRDKQGLTGEEVEELVQMGLQYGQTENGWVDYEKFIAKMLSKL